MSGNATPVTLRPVNAANWRDVARLTVTADQARCVATPTYYLAMCSYGDVWHPLAAYAEDQVVGFLMWGIDDADDSCWLGGILVDASVQGRGLGRAMVREALEVLAVQTGRTEFALSYQPENAVARRLYAGFGFVETGEEEDGEVVARLSTT